MVAIAISNAEEWEKFCRLLNKETWIEDEGLTPWRREKTMKMNLESLISDGPRRRHPKK